jgi:hypothetical protein
MGCGREHSARRDERWDADLAPEPVDPTIAGEIRRHISSLNAVDRVAFIAKHVAEAGPAVMQAPSFLSGFSPAELAVVIGGRRRAADRTAASRQPRP